MSIAVTVTPLHYNKLQYNTIQNNTIQYNAIQYNAIQHNTIPYTAIHCTLCIIMYNYIPMGSIFVNSLSNWEVSIEPITVGIQGGIIRPAARFSNSMSLCTLE